MTAQDEHPAVSRYLRDFDKAAGGLGPDRRTSLRAELASHLREAIRPDMSAEDVASVLRALGSPAEIVAAETGHGDSPVTRTGRRGAVLLVALAILFGAASLIVVGPSAAAYIWGPPGLYFSAFVWSLGALLALACAACVVAAVRLRRGAGRALR